MYLYQVSVLEDMFKSIIAKTCHLGKIDRVNKSNLIRMCQHVINYDSTVLKTCTC